MIVSRLVVDVGIGIVPRGHVLTPAMGFFIRTVEDVTASMLSRVIDVGIGIVPHEARADTHHGFLNSYSGRHNYFTAFTGY